MEDGNSNIRNDLRVHATSNSINPVLYNCLMQFAYHYLVAVYEADSLTTMAFVQSDGDNLCRFMVCS